MKYDDLLLSLEDDAIYSAGLITRHAVEIGYAESDQDKTRIRVSLNRVSTANGYPELGDGWVRLPGQAPVPGWYGWRWKGVVR